jgi:hypothetical protein
MSWKCTFWLSKFKVIITNLKNNYLMLECVFFEFIVLATKEENSWKLSNVEGGKSWMSLLLD